MLDLVNIREPRGFEDRVEAAVAPNSPSEFLSNLLAEHEDDVTQMLGNRQSTSKHDKF